MVTVTPMSERGMLNCLLGCKQVRAHAQARTHAYTHILNTYTHTHLRESKRQHLVQQTLARPREQPQAQAARVWTMTPGGAPQKQATAPALLQTRLEIQPERRLGLWRWRQALHMRHSCRPCTQAAACCRWTACPARSWHRPQAPATLQSQSQPTQPQKSKSRGKRSQSCQAWLLQRPTAQERALQAA